MVGTALGAFAPYGIVCLAYVARRTNIPADSFTHHKEFFPETATQTLP
ncbi:hypothetical protein WI560_31730 [Bradyrhizobium sp. A11]|jgi:hypothetical protein